MGRQFRWFLLAGGLLLFSSCESPSRQAYEPSMTSPPEAIALAKCLTAKGAKLYSANWCGACRYQKDLFGKEAVKELAIVDVDRKENRAECKRLKIRCIPTWIMPDGKKLEGARSLNELARKSGCR